jgi:hypothetical protein
MERMKRSSCNPELAWPFVLDLMKEASLPDQVQHQHLFSLKKPSEQLDYEIDDETSV